MKNPDHKRCLIGLASSPLSHGQIGGRDGGEVVLQYRVGRDPLANFSLPARDQILLLPLALELDDVAPSVGHVAHPRGRVLGEVAGLALGGGGADHGGDGVEDVRPGDGDGEVEEVGLERETVLGKVTDDVVVLEFIKILSNSEEVWHVHGKIN